ncbi:SRPBCC family protein [Actinoallomurus purpureus]|uniref:SRPBCC family protein n=1 Tax=Actinoallomurus purpureus TaxID=478114 RepID=UPI002092883C|nr:SRPBCC family protein [Actinoallomurus purpureus]MCO6008220.1 SRPBCC family protein [Actinoallomurus purpureus]
MWSYEHIAETVATPEAVWRLWADVPGWQTWNAEIEKVEIDGPFAVGSQITMTPPGDEPIVLKVAQAEENTLFVDEMDAGDFVVTTVHRIEPLGDGRSRIVYRTEIDGPAADQVGPQLGPAITADFPETVAALVRLAEGR